MGDEGGVPLTRMVNGAALDKPVKLDRLDRIGLGPALPVARAAPCRRDRLHPTGYEPVLFPHQHAVAVGVVKQFRGDRVVCLLPIIGS